MSGPDHHDRYGRRKVTRMYGEIGHLRQAIRAEGTPAVQAAWDAVEEHIDYAYQGRDPAVLAALPEVQALTAAAEARALDSVTTLHTVIADIRAATVGSKPMLSELAQALVAWRDEAVRAEREACAVTVEFCATDCIFEAKAGRLNDQWAAAIRKRGEGQP